MHSVGMTAFLKILTKGSPQKVKEYSKYLTPGGFDFYYPLKQAAFAATVGGEDSDKVLASIQSISGDVQRKYNAMGFMAMLGWMKKSRPSQYFAAPSTTVSTPRGHLSVKLEPELGAVINGERRLVHVWYSKDLSLSRTAVTVGHRLIQKHLCTGAFEDCKASILDLRKKQLLTVEGDTLVMDLMISGEFAWIDNFFQAHERTETKVA
jgi:hypothetical protein